MTNIYGCLEDRFQCDCGTTLVLRNKPGLATAETVKCFNCGLVYDFEISLTNSRYEDTEETTDE